MLKNIKKILIEILLLVYIIVFFSFAKNEMSNQRYKSINVKFMDISGNSFIVRSDIISILAEKSIKIENQLWDSVNLEQIERAVAENPCVEKVEVYRQIDGILTIEICQRTPIVRVQDEGGNSYYIDKNNKRMPLSSHYTARVAVANGWISENNYLPNHKYSGKDSLNKTMFGELFSISEYIFNDKFLSSLIEQIYVNSDYSFTLVPKLGPRSIEFGNAENFKEKFENLKIFYVKGFNKKGWETYSSLNLKFRGQIVCKKYNKIK